MLAAVWNWAIRKIELDANDSIYYRRREFKNLLANHEAMTQLTQECDERWLPIGHSDLAGRYEVSNYGRVRSLTYPRGKRRENPLVLKFTRLDSGHAKYGITCNGKGYAFLAARLVLLTFVGPPPGPSFEASHKDGNSANDFVGNLLWESHAHNEHRKVEHGTALRGETVPWSKLCERKVIELRRRFANGESVETFVKETSLARATIFNAVTGRTWKHI